MTGLDVIEHLAGAIGIRFAGTRGEERGCQYILEQFQALGLESSLERFQFLGWELQGEPVLELTGPVEERFPCFALVYSSSTPEQGYELPLRKLGPTEVVTGLTCNKYALGDPRDGRQYAHILTRLNGPGCAMPLPHPEFPVPSVMVGGEEARAFEQMVEEHPGSRARLTLLGRLKPDAYSANVLATLPGKESEAVVIVASHHDTEYNCPGAVDNASGVQGVLTLARRLKEQPPAKTIQFIAFGAEEPGLLGARYHVSQLKESGALQNVEAIVNLDMIACNSPTWINVTQDEKEFKVRVARVFERLGLFERFGNMRWQLPPWPTSDHAPFTEAGIPTLFISYEGQRYPHLHLPSDTVDKVNRELLDLSIACVHEILLDLCKMP